jgi:uncharacterized protein (DUF1330 family)
MMGAQYPSARGGEASQLGVTATVRLIRRRWSAREQQVAIERVRRVEADNDRDGTGEASGRGSLRRLGHRSMDPGSAFMTAQIKSMARLASCFVICCIGLGALHAQTKASAVYWVTETLEVSDQPALLNAIKAVPPTLQPFGGRYIVLGGKIAPGEGSPPRRITIVAFDSLEKAQQWFDSPAAAGARAEAQRYAKIRSYFVEGVGN